METNEIMAALARMLGMDNWRSEAGFPKYKVFKGASFLLQEPLNPKWIPSMSAYILGKGPSYAWDPSNGDGSSQFPRRSKNGYPLRYGVESGGALSTRLPATIPMGEANLENDAEVEVYLARDAARMANLQAYQAPAWTGAIPAHTLNDDDWCYAGAHPEVAWHTIIGGEWNDIATRQRNALYNRGPTFDPATYNGPLRGYVKP